MHPTFDRCVVHASYELLLLEYEVSVSNNNNNKNNNIIIIKCSSSLLSSLQEISPTPDVALHVIILFLATFLAAAQVISFSLNSVIRVLWWLHGPPPPPFTLWVPLKCYFGYATYIWVCDQFITKPFFSAQAPVAPDLSVAKDPMFLISLAILCQDYSSGTCTLFSRSQVVLQVSPPPPPHRVELTWHSMKNPQFHLAWQR